MSIINVGKAVGINVLGNYVFKAIEYVVENSEDIFSGNPDWGKYPKPDDKPKTEPKKKELENNLLRQGADLIQNNPELAKMAKRLEKFDKAGQLQDPFHRESTNVERQFKSKLSSLMEPKIHSEASKLGLKYQAPLSSIFRN